MVISRQEELTMTYLQLTFEDRVILSTLRKQGLSIRPIAKIMGRHFSTLYRELERNRCHVTDGSYRPFKAQRRTKARRRRSKRNRICHETIYQYVLRDKPNGGQLWRHLRQSPKQNENVIDSMIVEPGSLTNATLLNDLLLLKLDDIKAIGKLIRYLVKVVTPALSRYLKENLDI